MSLVDELEFERLEPTCCFCGTLLTFDEWEINGDYCSDCADREFLYKS